MYPSFVLQYDLALLYALILAKYNLAKLLRSISAIVLVS